MLRFNPSRTPPSFGGLLSKSCLPCRTRHEKCSHRLGKRILVIADTQVKPGVPMDHFIWIGKYIAAKRPDYIVHIGDHWDFPSLSSYDKGKKAFEGRRYKKDVAAGNEAMRLLTSEYRGIPGYSPQEHFFLGNHEFRVERAVEAQAELEDVIGYFDLDLSGWTVHPFLKIHEIEGIKFAHYFTSGVLGKPVSSAAVLLRQWGAAVMGHVQVVDMAVHPKSGEIALFAGTTYLHQENYLGFQGNNCRRQVVVLNEVRGDGSFDPMFVSLKFLEARYAK